MRIQSAALFIFLSVAAGQARADFRFMTTRRTTAGASVAGNQNEPSRYYFKGQKMKIETGQHTAVFDFEARTISAIDHARRTVSVASFHDADVAEAGQKIDIRETARAATINGFAARSVMLTTDLDSGELQQMGSRLRMEVDLWISREVPGAEELVKFYQRNMRRFPWSAMMEALNRRANPALVSALAALQRRIAGMEGVQVRQVVKVKPAEVREIPRLSAAELTRIRFAIAQLDAAVQKGGPEAFAAARDIARLKAAAGDDFLPGGAEGSLFEITMESLGFSSEPIPDSAFALPEGYRNPDAKAISR